jgi:hypothetical protein
VLHKQNQSKSRRNNAKVGEIMNVLENLDMSVQHVDNVDVQHQLTATAGLMLLPHLLSDKADYLYKVYQV